MQSSPPFAPNHLVPRKLSLKRLRRSSQRRGGSSKDKKRGNWGKHAQTEVHKHKGFNMMSSYFGQYCIALKDTLFSRALQIYVSGAGKWVSVGGWMSVFSLSSIGQWQIYCPCITESEPFLSLFCPPYCPLQKVKADDIVSPLQCCIKYHKVIVE